MSKKSTQEAKIINKQGNFVGPFFSSEVLHRLFLLDRLFFGSASAFFVIGCIGTTKVRNSGLGPDPDLSAKSGPE